MDYSITVTFYSLFAFSSVSKFESDFLSFSFSVLKESDDA